MFNINYSSQAKTFLKKADKILTKRLIEKIEKLQEEPVGHDTKSVKGTKLYRIRVGDYRILYEVDHKENFIGIVKIDKRPKAY